MPAFYELKRILPLFIWTLLSSPAYAASLKTSNNLFCDANTVSPLQDTVKSQVQTLLFTVDPLMKRRLLNCGYPEESPLGKQLYPKQYLEDPKNFIPEGDRRISNPTLFVVHAHKKYGQASKSGIDSLVETFKKRNHPVAYMFEDNDVMSWYPTDRDPNILCRSDAGENNFDIRTNEVVVVGGLYGACHTQTWLNIVKSAIKNNQSPFTVHLPMDAITAANSKNLSSWLSENQNKNEELIKDGMSLELLINHLTKAGVDCKIYLDGKSLKTVKATSSNSDNKSVEIKFWSSSKAYSVAQEAR